MVQERKKPEFEPINVDERIFAEREIVRYVQGTNLHEELSHLRKSVADSQARINHVKKSSPIDKLDPKLEDDLMCWGPTQKRTYSNRNKTPSYPAEEPSYLNFDCSALPSYIWNSGLEHVLHSFEKSSGYLEQEQLWDEFLTDVLAVKSDKH